MRKIRSSRGFTLIEVIAVLILIGILAAVAIPRITDNTANEVGAANALKAHLRFAHMQAMNSDTRWGVKRLSGSSYQLFYIDGSNTDHPKSFPGENSDIVRLSRAEIEDSFRIFFDEWGRPSDDSPIKIGSQEITITPETGFIP